MRPEGKGCDLEGVLEGPDSALTGKTSGECEN